MGVLVDSLEREGHVGWQIINGQKTAVVNGLEVKHETGGQQSKVLLGWHERMRAHAAYIFAHPDDISRMTDVLNAGRRHFPQMPSLIDSPDGGVIGDRRYLTVTVSEMQGDGLSSRQFLDIEDLYTLEDIVGRRKDFSQEDLLIIAGQLCRTTRTLLSDGIYQRDPWLGNNIILRSRNEWISQQIDFGLAQLRGDLLLNRDAQSFSDRQVSTLLAPGTLRSAYPPRLEFYLQAYAPRLLDFVNTVKANTMEELESVLNARRDEFLEAVRQLSRGTEREVVAEMLKDPERAGIFFENEAVWGVGIELQQLLIGRDAIDGSLEYEEGTASQVRNFLSSIYVRGQREGVIPERKDRERTAFNCASVLMAGRLYERQKDMLGYTRILGSSGFFSLDDALYELLNVSDRSLIPRLDRVIELCDHYAATGRKKYFGTRVAKRRNRVIVAILAGALFLGYGTKALVDHFNHPDTIRSSLQEPYSTSKEYEDLDAEGVADLLESMERRASRVLLKADENPLSDSLAFANSDGEFPGFPGAHHFSYHTISDQLQTGLSRQDERLIGRHFRRVEQISFNGSETFYALIGKINSLLPFIATPDEEFEFVRSYDRERRNELRRKAADTLTLLVAKGLESTWRVFITSDGRRIGHFYGESEREMKVRSPEFLDPDREYQIFALTSDMSLTFLRFAETMQLDYARREIYGPGGSIERMQQNGITERDAGNLDLDEIVERCDLTGQSIKRLLLTRYIQTIDPDVQPPSGGPVFDGASYAVTPDGIFDWGSPLSNSWTLSGTQFVDGKATNSSRVFSFSFEVMKWMRYFSGLYKLTGKEEYRQVAIELDRSYTLNRQAFSKAFGINAPEWIMSEDLASSLIDGSISPEEFRDRFFENSNFSNRMIDGESVPINHRNVAPLADYFDIRTNYPSIFDSALTREIFWQVLAEADFSAKAGSIAGTYHIGFPSERHTEPKSIFHYPSFQFRRGIQRMLRQYLLER